MVSDFLIGLLRLDNRVVKNCGQAAQLVCPVDHTDETLPYIQPNGILLLKLTKGKLYELFLYSCVCTCC